MARTQLHEIEEEAQRYGINKETTYGPNRRVDWIVTCRGIGRTPCPNEPLAFHWGPTIPVAAMLKHIRQRNWQVDRGDRPLCPYCQKAITRKASELYGKPKFDPIAKIISTSVRAAELIKLMPEPIKEPIVMNAPTPVVQPSAKITRQVFAMLEDPSVLDCDAKCYVGGFTDEKVAAEVGCHVSLVQRIRMEAFCDLVEDQRLSVLRDDLNALEKAMNKVAATARDDIQALRSRIDQVAASTKSR